MNLEIVDGPAAPRPPSEVRFVAVTAEPYPDRRRIKLTYEITPFLQRPGVEIRLQDPAGGNLGSITVVDLVGAHFSLTAHLRGVDPPPGSIRVVSTLGYDDLPDVDRHETTVELPAAAPHAGA